jgi:hypothetical protein
VGKKGGGLRGHNRVDEHAQSKLCASIEVSQFMYSNKYFKI